jgi:RHS repeat-associated protein
VTNALSQTTSFTYNNAGRVITQTLPGSREIDFTYDANGNLASVTTPTNNTHSIGHNGFDLLSSYAPPEILPLAAKMGAEKVVKKGWESLTLAIKKFAAFVGKFSPKAQKQLVNKTVNTTNYSYNDDRQLTQVSRPDSSTIAFAYGSTTGVLSTITIPSGTNTYYWTYGVRPSSDVSYDSITNEYDWTAYLPRGGTVYLNSSPSRWGYTTATYNTDHLISSDEVTSNGTTSGTTISYTYDNDGLLTDAGSLDITRSSSTGFVTATALGDVTEDFSYTTTFGELSEILGKYQTTNKYREQITRDHLGRISSVTETYGATSNTYDYTYDSSGRLVDVDKDSTQFAAYTYDGNSNITSRTVSGTTTGSTFNEADEIETFGTKNYTFNVVGELQSVTDTAPNPDDTTSYSYDVLGNLKSVTLPNSTVISYKVDARNRRVTRKVGSTVTHYYLYDTKNRVIATLDSSGVIESRFIYGSRPFTPDYMLKGGNTYKIVSNHLGSPVMVIKTSDGTVTQEIHYNEWGKVISDSNAGFQPFGFAGGLYDPDTKLVRFGARDYDADTGRWTTRDPILFRGGDANLFGYVFQDPINFIDPSGLAPGDEYSTERAAASAALNGINPVSIALNREAAGYIYRTPNGYSYTPPNLGDPTGSHPGIVPNDPTGFYHTHGSDLPGYNNNDFSWRDENAAYNSGLESYMMGPNGAMKRQGNTCH